MNRGPDELLLDAIRRAPGPVPSAALTAAVRARASVVVRKRGLPTWINVAAALVLVVGAATWLRVADRVPEAIAPVSMPSPASPGVAPVAAPAAPTEVMPKKTERARMENGSADTAPVGASTAAADSVDSGSANRLDLATKSPAPADVSQPPEIAEPLLQGAMEPLAKSGEQAFDKAPGSDTMVDDSAAGPDQGMRALAAQELPVSEEPAVAAPPEPFVSDPPMARPAPAADAPMMAAPEPPAAPGASMQMLPPETAPPPPPSMSAPSSAEPAPAPQAQSLREQSPHSIAPRDEARKLTATTDPRFAQLRTALAQGDSQDVEALLQTLKREVPRAQWPEDLADRFWPR